MHPVSLRAISMYAWQGLTIHQVSLCQVKDALKEKPRDPAVKLPIKLNNYQDMFSLKEAEKLLPY
jgi:hypothetical protein